MSRARRLLCALAAVAAALALPAAASAHAVLLATYPSASGVLDVQPQQVRLTYSEAVEPRFAIVSVTNAAGRQQTLGPPQRSPADPDELDVPLRKLAQGWYLVFWRAISVDGHPVRGAFTFAIGPNPGPAPQFPIPSVSETAATPQLLAGRWVVFLSAMAAIGLFVLRTLVARPLVPRVEGTRLRAVSIAFWISLAVALVATPIYVLLATAQFALRSVFDVGALVPLMRVSQFGRGYLDLELELLLFAAAAAVALWLDRPERARRSIGAILAELGALLAAGAALLAPGASGHAAQTAPRALAIALDWLHLVAGSLWIGGLVGLLVLWGSLPAARRVAGLTVCVPRFSNVAFVSVLALIGSGIGAALLHLPTFSSLWQTSYGQALVAKISLLLVAMGLAALNLTRTRPRLQASAIDPALGRATTRTLRRLVGGEAVLVAAALFAAAVLTSLPPPAKALATIGKPTATVGPGAVTQVVQQDGYRLEFHLQPNRAAVQNSFAVAVSRGGAPVRGATVTATFTMLDMEMGSQSYQLAETSPGLYRRAVPALVMVGKWGLSFEVQPPGKPPVDVLLIDHANG
ncbi:MAG TPA: copper resistance protein CopC [Gaiellaceae bacterium]|nr:copper resistance protein CopC [Gaiellaceae bacterium]